MSPLPLTWQAKLMKKGVPAMEVWRRQQGSLEKAKDELRTRTPEISSTRSRERRKPLEKEWAKGEPFFTLSADEDEMTMSNDPSHSPYRSPTPRFQTPENPPYTHPSHTPTVDTWSSPGKKISMHKNLKNQRKLEKRKIRKEMEKLGIFDEELTPHERNQRKLRYFASRKSSPPPPEVLKTLTDPVGLEFSDSSVGGLPWKNRPAKKNQREKTKHRRRKKNQRSQSREENKQYSAQKDENAKRIKGGTKKFKLSKSKHTGKR